MAERSITFSITGYDSECPECGEELTLDGVKLDLVTVEFLCPHCGQECCLESEDIVFPKERH